MVLTFSFGFGFGWLLVGQSQVFGLRIGLSPLGSYLFLDIRVV